MFKKQTQKARMISKEDLAFTLMDVKLCNGTLALSRYVAYESKLRPEALQAMSYFPHRKERQLRSVLDGIGKQSLMMQWKIHNLD